MELLPETSDKSKYLALSEIINFEDENIQKTTMNLSNDISNEIQLIKTVYEFVRDEISHSLDIKSNVITFRASDVLKYKHGICIAKSHLLAALLRSLNIPAGFCYQKLEFDEGYGLHGLNGVFISSLDRWIRLDARGNKEGINAQFSIDKEILAYYPNEDKGELDFPIIYSEPNKKMIEILERSMNLNEVLDSIVKTEWLNNLF